MIKKVLVFPCGSEIGLEIHKSLKYSTSFSLIEANSINDHGKFVYEEYIGDLPFINSPNFIAKIKEIIIKNNIDIIYPAMDLVMSKLKSVEKDLGCIVVGSNILTNEICISKENTYETFKNIVKVPQIYKIDFPFPVFAKPKIGYGSRGAKKINTQLDLDAHLNQYDDIIITEYLPGVEYTVDCFTNRKGILLFCKPRIRNRISNGISVNSFEVIDEDNKFGEFAYKINKTICLRGAWFFQVKKNKNGELVLLEIACRLGGSSSLFRSTGVNFAMLSVYDSLNYDVEIFQNNYKIELDRALYNKYKTSISYNEVFIDFDDCIILNNHHINIDLMKFIFQCINHSVKITILSKHKGNLKERLINLKINALFDRVIHLQNNHSKSNFIDNQNSIFIDDSFSERKDVFLNKKIPVFSPDMIECLFK